MINGSFKASSHNIPNYDQLTWVLSLKGFSSQKYLANSPSNLKNVVFAKLISKNSKFGLKLIIRSWKDLSQKSRLEFDFTQNMAKSNRNTISLKSFKMSNFLYCQNLNFKILWVKNLDGFGWSKNVD